MAALCGHYRHHDHFISRLVHQTCRIVICILRFMDKMLDASRDAKIDVVKLLDKNERDLSGACLHNALLSLCFTNIFS